MAYALRDKRRRVAPHVQVHEELWTPLELVLGAKAVGGVYGLDVTYLKGDQAWP